MPLPFVYIRTVYQKATLDNEVRQKEVESRAKVWAYPSTLMYSANERLFGIGRLSSRSPARCIAIAECIRLSTAGRVLPVAAQPGRSDEYAE